MKPIKDSDPPSIDLEHEKWRKLYLAKLKGCYRLADFSETKNDLDFKEQKKDALIELIDILDDPAAPQYLLNDLVLREAIKLIEANLFRTFSNKSKEFKLFNSSLIIPIIQLIKRQQQWIQMRMSPT